MSPVTQPEPALVLFSGGQDSATCLAWALARFAAVETVGFDYGQRHRVELDCRGAIRARLAGTFPDWAGKLGEDHLIDLSVLGRVSDTALTRERAIVFEQNGLPNTFVPGRNLLFFTFAAALGYRRGIRHLVGGMCETDYSRYPDCRDDTLKALQATLYQVAQHERGANHQYAGRGHGFGRDRHEARSVRHADGPDVADHPVRRGNGQAEEDKKNPAFDPLLLFSGHRCSCVP